MPEQAELERLAGAISMLRPDWPAGSVKRFIAGRPELANRPLRDLGLALFWVATDPDDISAALHIASADAEIDARPDEPAPRRRHRKQHNGPTRYLPRVHLATALPSLNRKASR